MTMSQSVAVAGSSNKCEIGTSHGDGAGADASKRKRFCRHHIMVLCGRFNQAREVEPPAIFAQLILLYSTISTMRAKRTG